MRETRLRWFGHVKRSSVDALVRRLGGVRQLTFCTVAEGEDV